MKYQLIINNNAAFITSDEELNKNDKPCKCYNSIKNTWNDDIVLFQGVMPMYHYKGFKKIIAGIEGLPSIDWNSLEEEFGWIDVEKLAMDKLKNKWAHLYQFGYPQKPFPTNYENDLNLVKVGIYETQSLNQKKFSLEDVKKIAQAAFTIKSNNETLIEDFDKWFSNRTKSLQQPKVFDIEVEKHFNPLVADAEFKPKITNNSIKILKKL